MPELGIASHYKVTTAAERRAGTRAQPATLHSVVQCLARVADTRATVVRTNGQRCDRHRKSVAKKKRAGASAV